MFYFKRLPCGNCSGVDERVRVSSTALQVS
jgi:hypothetical protein